jgi:hypothetical protein
MKKIHGTNVHVLPDENLGGVLREFVEVDRKPKDGELIINYGNNRIHKTKAFAGSVTFYDVETNEQYTGWADINGKLHYRTLEPTDIVHIDDQRYRLVDRKAKVGEKVIALVDDGEHYKLGDVLTVYRLDDQGGVFVNTGRPSHPHRYIYDYEYDVLEPVEPAETDDDVLTVDETEVSKSVLDLLANLARRVTQLERKFENLESRQKRLMGRIVDTEEKLEKILDDIVTLDERTQPLVKPIDAIPTFKYSDLVGKTLKIYGARDGDYVTVLGYEESTGNSYVLFSGKEGGES